MKKIVVSLLSIFIFFSAFSTNAFAATPKYVAGHHGYWEFEPTGGSCGGYWNFRLGDGKLVHDAWVQSENEVDWYYVYGGMMFAGNGCFGNSPWLVIDGRWYLFAADGKLVRKEGWEKTSSGKWIYWIPGNYGLATNESKVINGVTYYFDSNGYMK
ncbi:MULTISPECIES: hypothetical protein [unclassified Bacillus (in: firmicutes)]|uniref:hypothetical protein n=1 Tax=unclassified Bacillus (in: firmicutes) TaxID=185979 RepID=UPI0008EFAF19|nr:MULTISPECIES: hypothetical protein [unclassified Bacillus (in: firmicutes)]SFI35692.1 Putative cell wall binding repeat-containing protein [Bacillus sp. 71mf]SFS35109.1 Putative cell wall binding repeat-containing protein [Bacillus sp. 103mf]